MSRHASGGQRFSACWGPTQQHSFSGRLGSDTILPRQIGGAGTLESSWARLPLLEMCCLVEVDGSLVCSGNCDMKLWQSGLAHAAAVVAEIMTLRAPLLMQQ